MECFMCKHQNRKIAKFCSQCGMPQGEVLEFASAIPGSGAATIRTKNGDYEVTWRDGVRTTIEKV